MRITKILYGIMLGGCRLNNSPPQDIHVLTPRTCQYVSLHGNGALTDVIKLKISRMKQDDGSRHYSDVLGRWRKGTSVQEYSLYKLENTMKKISSEATRRNAALPTPLAPQTHFKLLNSRTLRTKICGFFKPLIQSFVKTPTGN